MQAHADRGIPIDRDLWITGIENLYVNYVGREFVGEEKERIRRHLVKHPEITAVFAEECSLAGIVREAAEAAGRCVPRDLSIVTIDACCECSNGAGFTHIRQKELEMGTRATGILHRQIQRRGDPEHILLVGDLIEGRSTAARSSI